MTSGNTTERTVKRRPGNLGQLIGWVVWHCRKGLTPVGYVGVLGGLGLALYATHSPWWAVPAAAGVAAGACLARWGEHLSGPWQALVERLTPEALDFGQRGVLDHWEEKAYAGGALGGGGLLCSALAVLGPSEPMGWAWGVGLLGIGGPWWWHYGWRVRGWRKWLNRWAWQWDSKVVETLPVFAQSKVLRCTKVDGITEMLIDPGPGVEFEQVAGKGPAIASAYSRKLRKGAVTVAEYIPA